MRSAFVGHVAWKEILSTVRDRRAILSNLLVPFFMLPLFMLGMPFLLGGLFEREAQSVSDVAVVSVAEVPNDLRFYLGQENVRLVESADPRADVEAGTFAAGIGLPEGFEGTLAGGGRADVTVFAKTGNMRSDLIAGKIRSAVEAYRQDVVAERLLDAGLDPTVLEPVRVQTVDASTPSERASGFLSFLIPFFIVVSTLGGAQMAAIDATAGEKERGTLEVLLVAPVRRIEVVVGKFLATALFGVLASAMAILGYLAGGALLRSPVASSLGLQSGGMQEMMGGSLVIDAGSVAILVITALLAAGLVAALLIGLTAFARTFKEAQTYVAPLSFILILPMIGLQFADFFTFEGAVFAVPLLNAMLLIDQLVKGVVNGTNIVIVWLSTLAYTGLLLGFALHTFRREDVIFRT